MIFRDDKGFGCYLMEFLNGKAGSEGCFFYCVKVASHFKTIPTCVRVREQNGMPMMLTQD